METQQNKRLTNSLFTRLRGGGLHRKTHDRRRDTPVRRHCHTDRRCDTHGDRSRRC